MDWLEDLGKSVLNFNFVMIYVIHKILVLLKNHRNFFKDIIFKRFLKEYNRLLIDLLKLNAFYIYIYIYIFFFIISNNGKFKSWKRKHN